MVLWDSWLRGESPKAIGRAFGKPSLVFIASWPPVLRRPVETTQSGQTETRLDCPLCATCVFRCDAKKQRDFSPSPTNRPKCVARASDLSRRATNDLVFNLQLESTSLIISLRDKQDRYSDANNASIEAKARLVGLPLATHGFRSKSKFGIPQANSPPQSHPGP